MNDAQANELFHQVESIIQSVFDHDEITLSRSTVADDIEGWDSLNNIRLFVEFERTFGIKFSAAEISGLEDVGAIVDLIRHKLQTT